MVLSCTLLIGCSKHISYRIGQESYSLDYTPDSETCRQRGSVKIALGTVENQVPLKDSSYARTALFLPAPLIFINAGVHRHSLRLGQSAFDTQLHDFLRDAFLRESERSGCFEIVGDGSQEYTVHLTILGQTTKAPYVRSFFRYFTLLSRGSRYHQKAGPAQSHLVIKLELKDKERTVIREFHKPHTQSPIFQENSADKKLLYNYLEAMVESVSLAYKFSVEHSIASINRYISGQDDSYIVPEETDDNWDD